MKKAWMELNFKDAIAQIHGQRVSQHITQWGYYTFPGSFQKNKFKQILLNLNKST